MKTTRHKEIEDEIVQLHAELGWERSQHDRNSAPAREIEHKIAALEQELKKLKEQKT